MFVIKQNDTLPKLECQLFDNNNVPINLTLCNVRFHMVDKKNNIVINEEVEMVNLNDGKIRYNWSEGNTSISGIFRGEFEVNLPNGDIITVPNDSYFTISIVPELS